MPWVHPFTSMIAGPTGSGKSMFVRRFVPNIKHMMTPKPDRILWFHGEYQTLYGTVEGNNFNKVYRIWTIEIQEKSI
jgi:ABC-type iron transport system FetAB ATPase subunit